MEKRIYRPREGKVLVGVCAGIANYFNIDPVLVRLGWIIFCCQPLNAETHSHRTSHTPNDPPSPLPGFRSSGNELSLGPFCFGWWNCCCAFQHVRQLQAK